jgi:uncharacterized protein YjbI with pentapeptide repeats
MANDGHLKLFKRDVRDWNRWRDLHPNIVPDLSQEYLGRVSVQHAEFDRAYYTGENFPKANLSHADLSQAYLVSGDFREATFVGAMLVRAQFLNANFSLANLLNANLSHASLTGANFSRAVLREAILKNAALYHADFSFANLTRADLSQTILKGANFSNADLSGAVLSGADLTDAALVGTNLRGANLREATLMGARIIQANLEDANLTNCAVYGISSWEVQLNNQTEQTGLIISKGGDPFITVDNLEVAQFIHLLLNNQKIRDVIDTITSKAVLILGRFTPERKAVLDAIREELRRRNYLPILFDFETPRSRDFTETVRTLAHIARFIIADLTEPSSLPKELESIAPTLAVPVQPILEGATRPYSMFQDYWKHPWVLRVYRYEALEGLIASLGDGVIAPAEAKVRELEDTRRAVAEEMLKQRRV